MKFKKPRKKMDHESRANVLKKQKTAILRINLSPHKIHMNFEAIGLSTSDIRRVAILVIWVIIYIEMIFRPRF